jgi:hypothetical protein
VTDGFEVCAIGQTGIVYSLLFQSTRYSDRLIIPMASQDLRAMSILHFHTISTVGIIRMGVVDDPKPIRGKAALNRCVQACQRLSPACVKAEREQPDGFVFAKLGDPDRTSSQPILDHA